MTSSKEFVSAGLLLALVLSGSYTADFGKMFPTSLSLQLVGVVNAADHEGEEAVIDTGDAASQGTVENVVNTNEINTEGDNGGDEDPPSGEGGDLELTVENENEAEIANTVEVDAATGDNSADGNQGGAVISSGNAVALADIFNLVNTNIINSLGLFLFLSNLGQSIDFVDLRQYDLFGDPEAWQQGCETECGDPSSLDLSNQNNVNITNDVVVRSSTGNNAANGNGAGAAVGTGNAYGVANVVNIANTNIVDSNYLLMMFNNFGSWDGDIVFPGSSFFSNFFGGSSSLGSEVTVQNDNEAEVSNTVETDADTGDNQAADNGEGSLIQTGNAHAGANVFSQVNTNLFGGASFFTLLRVGGDWSGNVFGLPPGISWEKTSQGLMLYSDPYDAGLGGGGSSGDTDVSNTNAASITNNVQVFALTGDNQVNSNGGGGAIGTGDAFAVANVANVVNTNIIGRNWVFAIFNILGNWSGDIAFGRPDLWIGAHATVPNDPLQPGDTVIYTFTVMNNGDSPATQVKITDFFSGGFLNFGDANAYSGMDGDEVFWSIGTLYPGEVSEVGFTATVGNVPNGNISLPNTVTVTSLETDENLGDNTDSLIVRVSRPLTFRHPSYLPPGVWDNPLFGPTTAPNLRVAKYHRAAHELAADGDEVAYTIIVFNDSTGSAYDAVLQDVLENEDGEVINVQRWNLETIYPGEEITVTYTMMFDEDILPGKYYNKAQVTAVGGASNGNGYPVESNVAMTSPVEIEEEDEGEAEEAE